jgi:hypothetical protein
MLMKGIKTNDQTGEWDYPDDLIIDSSPTMHPGPRHGVTLLGFQLAGDCHSCLSRVRLFCCNYHHHHSLLVVSSTWVCITWQNPCDVCNSYSQQPYAFPNQYGKWGDIFYVC